MNEAKIRLSAEEAELVNDPGIILTKNAIVRKVNLLLGSLSEDQKKIIAELSLPPEVTAISPKIAKGENYNGLPWLMLDHPRFFDKENVFAIRTMFWWGNFFSIALHLGGSYKKLFEEKLSTAYDRLVKEGIYCCVNDDQWEHHFEEDNYVPVKSLPRDTFNAVIKESSFIKLAKRYPLHEWDQIIEQLGTDFRMLLTILEMDQLPRR